MTTQNVYSLYDLSFSLYQNCTINFKDGKTLTGHFVKFIIKDGMKVTYYPSDRFCFLPADKTPEFFRTYGSENWNFKKYPKHIKEYDASEIKSITLNL
jgi:hypothetical protein